MKPTEIFFAPYCTADRRPTAGNPSQHALALAALFPRMRAGESDPRTAAFYLVPQDADGNRYEWDDLTAVPAARVGDYRWIPSAEAGPALHVGFAYNGPTSQYRAWDMHSGLELGTSAESVDALLAPIERAAMLASRPLVLHRHLRTHHEPHALFVAGCKLDVREFAEVLTPTPAAP